jgi:signal peptidase I
MHFLTQWRVRSQLLLDLLLVLLVLAVAVRRWVWSPVLVSGESMAPTLHHGQLGGVNKLAYQLSEPSRGDLVVFWTGHDRMVKRIIGLPGEEVESRNGGFLVNGRSMAEPYVKVFGLVDVRAGKLAPDCFLVAGDNRSQSVLAIVRRDRILGRFTSTEITRAAR